MDIPDYLSLAHSCAAACYDTVAPSPAYADRAARMLLGTAATESHLHYRRQTVFDWSTDRGAWGLWQTEAGSVGDGIRMLKARPLLAKHAAQWLFQQDDASMQPILDMPVPQVLRILSGWDRLAILFCRLHYLRAPGAIPETMKDQARYWKQFYNTVAGKGTVDQYVSDWDRLVASKIKA